MIEQQPTAPLPPTPPVPARHTRHPEHIGPYYRVLLGIATVSEGYVELLREQGRTAEAAAVGAKGR